MLHRLFTVLAALSLLLCVAVAVLWVRNGSVMDGLRYCDPSGAGAWSHTVHTRNGALHYLYVGPGQSTPPGWEVVRRPQPARFVAIVDKPRREVMGFASGGVGNFWFISVPFWAMLVTSFLPVAWCVRRLRHPAGRAAAGLCPKCGYDLRATPGRCPECGRVPAGRKA